MKTLTSIAFFAVVVIASPASFAQEIGFNSYDLLSAPESRAIVEIQSIDGGRRGKGVIIGKSARGLAIILAPNEIIKGSEKNLSVAIEGTPTKYPAQLILESWRNDAFALLATRSPVAALPAMKYGGSQSLAKGTRVFVPIVWERSLQARSIGEIVHHDQEVIIFDFPVNSNDIGLPLLDDGGNMIGLVIPGEEQFGHAVPIDRIRFVTERWLAKTSLAETWQGTSSSKPWYGWVIGGVLIIGTGAAVIASDVF